MPIYYNIDYCMFKDGLTVKAGQLLGVTTDPPTDENLKKIVSDHEGMQDATAVFKSIEYLSKDVYDDMLGRY